MELVSLEELQEQEHSLLDDDYDSTVGLDFATSTDKYMRLNHDRMGEDSEEVEVRRKHASTVLQNGQIPHYQPY